MLSRKQKHILLKFFSMFSVIRGYNIIIIIIAQYLTSIYILAHNKPLKSVIFDLNLLMLVLASAATIAGGYIINNFYDYEKDLINRPQKSILDRLVSQNTKLSLYFILNFIAVIMASYKNFDQVIFVHATFLFLIVSMRELTKDLENIKGDLALGYKTIPISYGEEISKVMLTVLMMFTLIPTFLLVTKFEIGKMYYFFYLSVLLLIIFLILLWKSKTKTHYLILHNILKFIIVLGVFSILLIDVDIVLKRIL